MFIRKHIKAEKSVKMNAFIRKTNKCLYLYTQNTSTTMGYNRYKSVDVGSGRFGGGGSIGESDESEHEASSEEKYFYKENKYRVEKLKQVIAYRNKQIDEHIEEIIKIVSQPTDKK
ncbi:PREDICTED: uncharacterized protein LOC107163096 [Diuraphis noxia]|uniref:uncharacterized protein LOC107163096 n=1 Tax=Diuraphis noxia TaxID=143948 RepID=UPI0007639EB2|nr:PREDICTED: uncharacterized protein LOC107163096 [Diuraphis noxia]